MSHINISLEGARPSHSIDLPRLNKTGTLAEGSSKKGEEKLKKKKKYRIYRANEMSKSKSGSKSETQSEQNRIHQKKKWYCRLESSYLQAALVVSSFQDGVYPQPLPVRVSHDGLHQGHTTNQHQTTETNVHVTININTDGKSTTTTSNRQCTVEQKTHKPIFTSVHEAGGL